MQGFRNKIRETRVSGLSLIEIIVSLILFTMGVLFLTRIFVAGKYFLKQAENKSKAMGEASMVLEEYLTQSYAALQATTDTGTDSSGFFHWTVNISEKAKAGSGKDDIPYKLVEVLCSYDEENIDGSIVKKTVRLTNIIPYPLIHLVTGVNEPPLDIEATHGPPFNVGPLITIPFKTLVRKDLMVVYNIAIDVQDPTNSIQPSDLVITKCFLTDKGTGKETEREIPTGTPVLSQPSISNSIGINNLTHGNYELRIRWYKEQGRGIIKLKKINVLILLVEHQ